MNRDEFQDLALRVTEGFATPAERALFEEALSGRPEYREEWLALRRELQAAGDAMADAADLAGPVVSMSASRMEQLAGEGDPPAQARRGQRWLIGGLAAAACLAAVLWLAPPKNSRELPAEPNTARLAFVVPGGGLITVEAPGSSQRTGLPVPLQGDERITVADGQEALLLRADGTVVRIRGIYAATELTKRPTDPARTWLTVPLAQLAAGTALTRGTGDIRIHSPRGATSSPEPVVAWAAEPGKTYDVELQDALQPHTAPTRVAGVVSPVAFNLICGHPLAIGSIFIVSVAETGRPATATRGRFMVVAPASLPVDGAGNAARMVAAFAALTESPARTGDAWLLLQQLPAEWRESELGLRLARAVESQ